MFKQKANLSAFIYKSTDCTNLALIQKSEETSLWNRCLNKCRKITFDFYMDVHSICTCTMCILYSHCNPLLTTWCWLYMPMCDVVYQCERLNKTALQTQVSSRKLYDYSTAINKGNQLIICSLSKQNSLQHRWCKEPHSFFFSRFGMWYTQILTTSEEDNQEKKYITHNHCQMLIT